jgi:pyruvate,water dikinase
MEREGETLAGLDLAALSDTELGEEVERRRETYRRWHAVYWDEMIPLAHGVRLFGELYGATMKPEDPYEFVGLLQGSSLRGVERNERLLALAARIEAGDAGEGQKLDEEDRRELGALLARFGGAFEAGAGSESDWRGLLLRLGRRGRGSRTRERGSREELERRYLDRFEGEERERARALLDLARASYRLRDDDNIVLGRIESQVRRAEAEQVRRGLVPAPSGEVAEADGELALSAGRLRPRSPAEDDPPDSPLRPRQLLGHAAGPGVARGRARVILRRDDLFGFEEGELLVCDAVDPNMTFVVPLAGAVVERRGGMLIHGAIIAREYGLPCVTGIEEATVRIRTGDEITVDGYLGLVTVHGPARKEG